MDTGDGLELEVRCLMKFTPGARAAVIAAFLAFPLCLASCAGTTAEDAGTLANSGVAAGVSPTGLPQPQPLPLPEAAPGVARSALAQSAAGSATPGAGTTAPAGASTGAAAPRRAEATGGGSASADLSATPENWAQAETLPNAQAGGNFAGQTGRPANGTPVYFVAVDDGGSSGVRFGCNDSLVAIYRAPAAGDEPLQTSFSILFSHTQGPAGLYNSLADSTLSFVSGYFDGTTVVVNLTGDFQLRGECDVPRVEAQLTHTAVAAVGAARAEIYVDGRPLTAALGLP